MSTWGIFSGDRPFGAFRTDDLNDQIDALIKARPKYNLSPEYFKNRDMAANAAFGRNRAIQRQQEAIDQDTADVMGNAQNVSTSTSGLLGTLSSLYGNKTRALRDLAGDEANIQNQNLAQLYATNNALAEERDKSWNYNTNQPYQLKLDELVKRRKAKQENMWKILDTVGALAGGALAGPVGMSMGSRIFKNKGGGGGYIYGGAEDSGLDL